MDTQTVLALAHFPGWLVASEVALDNNCWSMVSALIQKLAMGTNVIHVPDFMPVADPIIAITKTRLVEKDKRYRRMGQKHNAKRLGKQPYCTGSTKNLEKGFGNDVEWNSPKWRQYEYACNRMRQGNNPDYDLSELEPEVAYDWHLDYDDEEEREQMLSLYHADYDPNWLIYELEDAMSSDLDAISSIKDDIEAYEQEIVWCMREESKWAHVRKHVTHMSGSEASFKLFDDVNNELSRLRKLASDDNSKIKKLNASLVVINKRMQEQQYMLDTLRMCQYIN